MSENYELLRSFGNEIKLFQSNPLPGQPVECIPGYRDGNGRTHTEILKLIGRVFLISGSPAPHVVIFAAVDSTADSSWICAQAGESLASQVEGKVCLIDADTLSPSMNSYFGLDIKSYQEIAHIKKSAKKSRAQSIRGSNLWLLPGELKTASESALKSPDRWKDRFSELPSQFSYVLFNAPPINESADALMLGRIADGVVLVVAANSTRRAAAVKARQSLDALNIRVLGVVLTQCTYPIPEALYKWL